MLEIVHGDIESKSPQYCDDEQRNNLSSSSPDVKMTRPQPQHDFCLSESVGLELTNPRKRNETSCLEVW